MRDGQLKILTINTYPVRQTDVVTNIPEVVSRSYSLHYLNNK